MGLNLGLILCLAVKESGFRALTKPHPTQQRAIFREKYANYISAGRKRLSLCMVRGMNTGAESRSPFVL